MYKVYTDYGEGYRYAGNYNKDQLIRELDIVILDNQMNISILVIQRNEDLQQDEIKFFYNGSYSIESYIDFRDELNSKSLRR